MRHLSKLLFGNKLRLEVAQAIATAKGDVYARQLADQLRTNDNQVTSELRNFEEAGLIERVELPSPDRATQGRPGVRYRPRASSFWMLASTYLDEARGVASVRAQSELLLNPRYSFDQFVLGDGNRLAHAASLAVAELPGQVYNPLFLYAPGGLGKTHLLHAIANHIRVYRPDTTVRYTTTEAFTNRFVAAPEADDLLDRGVEVLLVDDVQCAASESNTQAEFCRTFNAMYDSGRQLVLTCDRPPSELAAINERLHGRLDSGVVAEIAPPDFATRLTILRHRTALDGIALADPSVLELIATRITTDIRVLEGALIRVVAFHSLTGRPIDIDLTGEVLDSMVPPEPATTQSIPGIQAAVASHFGISVEALVSPSRAAEVAWPRQVAMHLARSLTDASLPAIGQAFGGRSHATVVHSCRRVAERVSTVAEDAAELAALVQSLTDSPHGGPEKSPRA